MVAQMSAVAAAASPGLSLQTTVKLRRGTEMPLFGLGTWLSEGGGTCKGAVASALDHGYRLIDTATMYQNEADVGGALQEGAAEGVFIVSKLQPSDHGREAALAAIDKTLAELKVAKLDLWLMHSPSGGKVVETWKAMLEVRRICACVAPLPPRARSAFSLSRQGSPRAGQRPQAQAAAFPCARTAAQTGASVPVD